MVIIGDYFKTSPILFQNDLVQTPIDFCVNSQNQRATKRFRLSWLTNSALVYEPKCGGWDFGVSVNEFSCMCTWSPNELWRSNSIFNLWSKHIPGPHKNVYASLWSSRIGFYKVRKLYRSWNNGPIGIKSSTNEPRG